MSFYPHRVIAYSWMLRFFAYAFFSRLFDFVFFALLNHNHDWKPIKINRTSVECSVWSSLTSFLLNRSIYLDHAHESKHDNKPDKMNSYFPIPQSMFPWICWISYLGDVCAFFFFSRSLPLSLDVIFKSWFIKVKQNHSTHACITTDRNRIQFQSSILCVSS